METVKVELYRCITCGTYKQESKFVGKIVKGRGLVRTRSCIICVSLKQRITKAIRLLKENGITIKEYGERLNNIEL